MIKIVFRSVAQSGLHLAALPDHRLILWSESLKVNKKHT